MKPALAKATESDTLEEVGRATLQVVHDLKNQLNGLKLYATFLRKRLEQNDRAQEERETLSKLIAGLDRAARDMTALVRYARPMEIRCQPHVDLGKLVLDNIRAASVQQGKSEGFIRCEIDEANLQGQFDSLALSQAIAAITEWDEYIRSETLADAITRISGAPAGLKESPIGQAQASIWIEKV